VKAVCLQEEQGKGVQETGEEGQWGQGGLAEEVHQLEVELPLPLQGRP